jgi:putative transposase
VDQHKEQRGLNRCLEALGLPKSTYYYHHKHDTPNEDDLRLMRHIREIIRQHPDYGYRRILPELCERTGETVNHKRLRRLLCDYELALPRSLPAQRPSAVRRILEQTSGLLNLVQDLDPAPLEVFSTDFTELVYGRGQKAYLMAVLDLRSRYVVGWAVGQRANRELALQCWEKVRGHMSELGCGLSGSIIHHDQDAVYTSYAWLSTVLLGDGMRVSYSERGAKDNPHVESMWGRMKTEIGSRIAEAESLSELREILTERFQYYNERRRHSALSNEVPLVYLERTLTKDEPEQAIPLAA